MKTLIVTAALALVPACSAAALIPTGRLGGGVEVGEQNGLSAKYWTTPSQAIAGGLGVSDGDFSMHGEYLFHSWDLFPKPASGDLAAHMGFGGRVRGDEFGLRPSIGADYWIENHPLEVFIDGGPIIRLTPDRGADFTVVVGVRAYLPGR